MGGGVKSPRAAVSAQAGSAGTAPDPRSPDGPQPPVAVLAIDGGNTKTDVALVAADGTLLASARGPGALAHSLGMEAALGVLRDLVRAAARSAGFASATSAGEAPLARHTCAFLAGADLPEEEDLLAAALRTQGWSDTSHVGNDTFAVLRAGTSRRWGVAVTCGAGINCVGVAPDGRTTRFLALGRFTGDWGGGFGLGEEVMWWAMRAADGRGPQTALREAVAAHFGVPAVRDVAVRYHYGQITDDDLAQLTYVLFRTAAVGDKVARDLVARQAQEVVVLAITAMRRLGLQELDTDVVLGGGLLAACDPILTGEIEERLRGEAPRATPRFASLPPIAGAALLGLEHVGATEAAQERLRASYASAAVA
jgi:N-acetylglucosamine kinase-like BadF-type ATPase